MKKREDQKNPPNTLPKWQKRYAELKQQLLQEVGFVCVGSLQTRYLECGKQGCHCHDSPANRHGPYHYWTRKVKGRTIAVLLSEPEVGIYQEWIQNNRRLDRLVREMRQFSARALTIQTGRTRP
jgi:hypothetical protein